MVDSSSGSHHAELPDWSNLSVLHKGTLTPRAGFSSYSSEADALSYEPEKALSAALSGSWKFHYANSPFEAPQGFQEPDFDTSKWDDIQVPSMWQLHGYGRPQYVNVQFPFPVDPPHVPYHDNETGSYITSFAVPVELRGLQLRLRFEGVDSAFHVWVNGKEVGYSQGSRSPSEFDITPLVNEEGENTLAVRVYQYCDGSYIEDQDQWRMSGIFRSVHLIGLPMESRIEDLQIRTVLDDKYVDATLNVQAGIYGAGKVEIKLLDSEKKVLLSEVKAAIGNGGFENVNFSLPVKSPRKWTAETPNLYNLVVSLDGKQFISQKVGFRQVELKKDGLIRVNGQRIFFRGVNRHEHHPRFGRTVPYEFLKHDLLIMKTHNINAIRTSHQPSDPRLYDLADELGFWVMDEADVECHGFEIIADVALPPEQRSLPFAERQKITRQEASQWTSNNPEWREAYVDRARQLVSRDKNHPCVVVWSLGNEAFFGQNFKAMTDYIRETDPTRVIHYEPDLEATICDMHSRMYPVIEDIVNFADNNPSGKPLVLCEYIHAMGTGPGNIKEYIDAFYEHPRLQGGFAWEWANHGLVKKNEEGEEFYAYGGDFGDIPNDFNFVMDGLLNSDHTPRPALLEYKKALEPIQLVSSSAETARFINRYDFANLDDLDCKSWLSDEEGQKTDLGTIEIPAGVGPGETVDLKLPEVSKQTVGATFVNLSFRPKKPIPWTSVGFEVATAQIPITPSSMLERPQTASEPALKTELASTGTILTITTEDRKTEWKFDILRGSLIAWKKNGVDLCSAGPVIDFWRAPTDNDAPQDGWEWKDRFLHLAKPFTKSVEWETKKSDVVIHITERFAPPVLSWSIDCTLDYTFKPGGYVELVVKGTPSGRNLPKTLPRIGMILELPASFQRVEWYGRGPEESYRDSKFSQPVGKYLVESVNELWTETEFPQESSNRTDTHWVKIRGQEELMAQFSKGDERALFDFHASHYRTADIDAAKHPFELHKKKQDAVILRLDAAHHGLGSGSCGPKTRPEYALKTEPFEFGILLS